MRQRHLLVCVRRAALLTTILAGVGVPLGAQVRASTDPLSGAWSGYIGRSEAQPSAVKVEFKLAAGRTVSGTVSGPQIMPGDINSGTFDPNTGALKFSVVVRAAAKGDGGTVTFDGRVAHDTASGTMILGGQPGVFKLMKEAAKSSASAAAKPAGTASDASAAAKRGFVEVSGWITRAADLVPAEKYSYRPVSSVRTFGQIIGHVVDGSRYYCARASGKTVQWSDATEKGVTTKAALVQALKQGFAECSAAYDGASQIAPLMENVAHSSLHYGNLVTYIRLLGMVPPSS